MRMIGSVVLALTMSSAVFAASGSEVKSVARLEPKTEAWTGFANGGFETNGGAGSTFLSNWLNYVQTGSYALNNFYAQTGTGRAVPGTACSATITLAAPTEGTYSTEVDGPGIGSEVLFQDLVLPAGQYVLAADVQVYNMASAFYNPPTLDRTVSPNQQFRIDLLDPSSAAYDTTSVLSNVYNTNASTAINGTGYFTVRASLGQWSGKTVRLRLGAANNQYCLFATVDNIRITPGSVNSSDINLDGKSDLIWRDTSSGNVVAWYMNNTTIASSGNLATAVPTSWKIVGTGDFNQDGTTDLLWENSVTGDVSIWQMNGSGGLISAVPLGASSSDWTIQGVGDFNKDGKPDILWRSASTGNIVVWFMNGTAMSGSATIGSASPSWRMEVLADLDRNGSVDMVWRYVPTGDVAVWLMNGTAIQSTPSLGNVPTNWRLLAAADYNGDGNPDLVWRDTSSGANVVWYMNGATQASTANMPTVSGSNWELVGPR